MLRSTAYLSIDLLLNAMAELTTSLPQMCRSLAAAAMEAKGMVGALSGGGDDDDGGAVLSGASGVSSDITRAAGGRMAGRAVRTARRELFPSRRMDAMLAAVDDEALQPMVDASRQAALECLNLWLAEHQQQAEEGQQHQPTPNQYGTGYGHGHQDTYRDRLAIEALELSEVARWMSHSFEERKYETLPAIERHGCVNGCFLGSCGGDAKSTSAPCRSRMVHPTPTTTTAKGGGDAIISDRGSGGGGGGGGGSADSTTRALEAAAHEVGPIRGSVGRMLVGGELFGQLNGYRGWHAASQLRRLRPSLVAALHGAVPLAGPAVVERDDPTRPLAVLAGLLAAVRPNFTRDADGFGHRGIDDAHLRSGNAAAAAAAGDASACGLARLHAERVSEVIELCVACCVPYWEAREEGSGPGVLNPYERPLRERRPMRASDSSLAAAAARTPSESDRMALLRALPQLELLELTALAPLLRASPKHRPLRPQLAKRALVACFLGWLWRVLCCVACCCCRRPKAVAPNPLPPRLASPAPPAQESVGVDRADGVFDSLDGCGSAAARAQLHATMVRAACAALEPKLRLMLLRHGGGASASEEWIEGGEDAHEAKAVDDGTCACTGDTRTGPLAMITDVI